MTSNPLGELDMELDAVLEAEVAERWAPYRSWAIVWTVELVLLVVAVVGALALDDLLVASGAPALVVGLIHSTILGLRARRRWARAHALLPDQAR